MGFLGMSGKTWKKIGGYALKAAPIVAAPFTGGLSLAALGAGTGALSGALGGGGWKGAALGAGMGAIPGLGGAGKAAGALSPTLGAGLKQAALTGGKQLAGSAVASKVPGPLGQIAGAGLNAGLSGSPGASFGANLRSAGKAALQQGAVGGAGVAGNYLTQPQGGYGGFGASPRPPGPGGYDFSQGPGNSFAQPQKTATKATSGPTAQAGGTPAQGGGANPGIVSGTGNNGFWGTWGPVIAQGAGAAAGIYAGKKATSSAMERSPEELQALRGAQGVGGDVASAAKAALGESKPWMQQAGNYYSTLLSGNRAAQAQAVAAPMAAISQQYRGAERGLERSGVRGAARDVAAGELGRDRVSKMAGLTTGVQPMAAEALGNLGINAGNQAASLYGTAGNVYGNLLNAGTYNRMYGRQEGERAAGAIGGLVADVGNTVASQVGKKTVKPGVPGPPPGPAVSSGVPAGFPGQQPVPPMPTFPTAPRAPAPRYPGGKVTPPILGGGAAGDYNPYKTVRF